MQISNFKFQINFKFCNLIINKFKHSFAYLLTFFVVKKQALLICLFAYLLITAPAVAAITPSPTESTSPTNSIDIKSNTRNIDVDELTKFSISGTKGKDNTLGISDLKKDVLYSFVGLYNKDTQRLLARSITEADTIPLFFEGAIFSVDSKEFQIQVVNNKGEKKSVDIQSSTKTSLSTVDGELTKSGFSKLNINERILIIGFADTKDSTLLSASRVIHFKEIPPSKEMQSYIKKGDDDSENKSDTSN